MKRLIDALKDDPFDLLILGGGITGAGIALDAVLRGLRVGLIDKGDFASGTSSVSSKLIHGGLRYLEHGQFSLVYEALHERRLLLHNAPHLVRPLRFVIPFYRSSRVPSWKWRLGLTLYDGLAGKHNLRRSGRLDRAHLRREIPSLESMQLTGGAHYYDAQMDDARLCLNVIRTAALHGARVANYVEAIGFERQDGYINGVRARDLLTGSEFVIRARQVVNAAGPWVDAICRLAGDADGPYLRPTKGVHVIVPNGAGLSAACLLLHPQDGRVFFVIPWFMTDPNLPSDKLLIGTTDSLDHDNADALTVNTAEQSYLLEGYNQHFRGNLEAKEILGSFAGLRPLIRSRPGQPSSLSREFRLIVSPSGLLSVAGGKFTTNRHMAQIATDEVVRRLGRGSRCRTRFFPLDGAPSNSWEPFISKALREMVERHGLSETTARHLVGRYGQRAFDVADYLRKSPELAQPLMPGEPEIGAEWVYQRDHEMAIFPADHWLRRMRLGLFHPNLTDLSFREMPRKHP